MTQPCAETLEREKDKLYVTDAELYRRLGVPAQTAKRIIPFLEDKQRFPRKQEMWGQRRYWPAVKAWLDRHNGLPVSDDAARLIPENRDRTRLPRPHHAEPTRRGHEQ